MRLLALIITLTGLTGGSVSASWLPKAPAGQGGEQNAGQSAPARPAERAEQVAPAPTTVPPNGVAAQPFDFNALPPAVRQMFEREADNYLRIGGEIWSVELFLRVRRLAEASAQKREPYLQKDAPLFYQPVGGRRARTLAEILPQVGDARLLRGTVLYAGQGNAVLQTSTQSLAHVTGLTRPVQKDQMLTVAVKPDGTFEYRVNGQPTRGLRYTVLPEQLVGPVTAEELAQHFAIHRIDRFHRWQARKVWDRLPKVKVVYDSQQPVRTQRHQRLYPRDYRTGAHIGMGQSTAREVVTDPGQYHWQWVAGGLRVPAVLWRYTGRLGAGPQDRAIGQPGERAGVSVDVSASEDLPAGSPAPSPTESGPGGG